MLINTYIQSVGDQVGGSFKQLPPTLIHLPRYQGAFVTLPSGLVLNSDRAIEWSLEFPIPNGVIALTNPYSNTPTIEFNPITYSGGDLKIRCSIRGQPNNFAIYVLFTTLTSVYKGGDYFQEESLIISQYQPTNINLTPTSPVNTASLFSNFNWALNWTSPIYTDNLIGYEIEKWNAINSSWDSLGFTSNNTYNNADFNFSHRVKSKYDQYINVNSIEFKYSNQIAPNIVGLDQYTLFNDLALNENISINQLTNSATFYVSIENPNLQEPLFLLNDVTLNDINIIINQNTSIPVFFTSIESFNYLIETYTMYNDIILNSPTDVIINQTSSNNIFWSESIGT